MATAFINAALVSIVMRFPLLDVIVDMIALANENASKNEDLDLCSVLHNDQDKSDTVKREEARLALKTRPMVLLHKESFA